jgi:hypothetical protein
VAIDLTNINLRRQVRALSAIVAIGSALIVIVNIISIYVDHVWQPKITVTKVDYDKGVATLIINGKTQVLYVNSSLYAGGGSWGVKFGINENLKSDRIELVKDGLTVKTIAQII